MDLTLSRVIKSSNCSHVDGAKFTVLRIRERFSRFTLLALSLLAGCATRFDYTPEQEPQYRRDAFTCEQIASGQINIGDRNQMYDRCMLAKGWRHAR